MASTSVVRAPYRSRSIRFLEVWEHQGWRLKVYGIACDQEHPRPALVETARRCARQVLPPAGEIQGGHGLGWLIIHDTPGGGYILVDWVARENEIFQHVFVTAADHPEQPAPSNEPAIGCVWELAVTDFERRAWLETILMPADGPQWDAYLDRRLDTDL